MTRPAKIQMIGPVVVLAMISAAELSGAALSQWPTSEILWRANLEWFHAIQKSSSILNAYPADEYTLLGAAGSLFGFGLWGFASNRPLPLAISSNLSFLYAVFLFCGSYLSNGSPLRYSIMAASSGAELGICAFLVGVSFLSAAVSHIHYVRTIGSGF